MNIAYSCRIFRDEMDEVFVVEGTDRETVLQELRYVEESKFCLDPRFPLTSPHTWSPPQKEQGRNADRETKHPKWSR